MDGIPFVYAQQIAVLIRTVSISASQTSPADAFSVLGLPDASRVALRHRQILPLSIPSHMHAFSLASVSQRPSSSLSTIPPPIALNTMYRACNYAVLRSVMCLCVYAGVA